jgi:hypothetical protein
MQGALLANRLVRDKMLKAQAFVAAELDRTVVADL